MCLCASSCIVIVLNVGKLMTEYFDDFTFYTCAKGQLPQSYLSHVLTVDRDSSFLKVLGKTAPATVRVSQ